MAISFEMIGKLSFPKDSEKFKHYEENEYASGWVNKTLRMNLTSGDNRFTLQSKAGFFKDGHGDIYVFSKDGFDANGNKVKGSMFTIPYKERLTHPRLSEVVEYRKWVVDLEAPKFRWELQSALNKVKEGAELTEEEVAKFGASDVKGLESALAQSQKKRKEFIAEADFVDFMKKVIDSGKYADKKFKISGNYDMQYSDDKNRWYCNYVPQRVYLAEDGAAETATATVTLYYDSEGLVDAKEEKGKYYVNGYTQVYDNNRKANVFAPYTIAIDANDNEKKVQKLVDIFTVEDGVKELGVVVDLLNGSQRKSIELEDLDEETQENILFGLTTLEDVQRELGGSVYGERVSENRFSKLGRGFARGCEDTAYSSEDLVMKALSNDTNAFEETESESNLFEEEDDDLDLFS